MTRRFGETARVKDTEGKKDRLKQGYQKSSEEHGAKEGRQQYIRYSKDENEVEGVRLGQRSFIAR